MQILMETTMAQIQVKPVGYSLGAQVTGVDISRPLTEQQVLDIKDAWTRHQVLVFPDQDLNPESLLTFSRNFGDLDNFSSQPFNRHPDYDEIFMLSNKPINGKVPPGSTGGQNWHTDLSYTIRPAKATLVYCIEKPSVGGDTMFANMYDAYETLSPVLQQFLDGLEAVHDVNLITAKRPPEIVAEFARLNPPVIHPAIRAHPDSNRKALYVNPRTRRFVGMTEPESAPLIKYLSEHAVSPRFVYRHRWSVRDLVMWDNRCLTHLAVGDFDRSEIRHMLRTSTMGDYYGRYEDEATVAETKKNEGSKDLAKAISLLHD